ncbi:purine nucleoside phosphorylase [Syntrophotalea carbinolica DSM 2380]|uniref:Purine nucleoside phosphorylase n=1 Tax=Syntrophotalea carbinolica (strain DSM 2380 / NBRC 103641 / GraBd1) TaxID=338963 RepID=Q3A2Z8_SYNC1|nr:purine-nucleoside phosphorylase [Syntrophotalea carbinolica]ABA89259.1 purine nucleoside phosphorylase [Syntrophotalea carbinolica DSM 2380]
MGSVLTEENLGPIVEEVHARCGMAPFDLALILGSGLGQVADAVEDVKVWEYRDFSCFPAVAVAGHAGRLLAGTLHGRRVLIFQGRFHLYQGLTAWQTAVPVRLAHALGCRRLLLTNAVGGIHPDLDAGCFMFVADHINVLGDNPLRGMCGDTFVDLSRLYRTDLFKSLRTEALSHNIHVQQGVLAAVPGPSYETPAEVRALRQMGADAVSMSLIPEAIMAGALGLEVVGLSSVTNRAAGLGTKRLCHDEVLASGSNTAKNLSVLVASLCLGWF